MGEWDWEGEVKNIRLSRQKMSREEECGIGRDCEIEEGKYSGYTRK